MKTRFGLGLLLTLVFAGPVYASDDLTVTRVSTGILAGGSFFSVYEVQCPDATRPAIVSLNRRTKWCAQEGAGVACLRDHREAALQACRSVSNQVAQIELVELANKALN